MFLDDAVKKAKSECQRYLSSPHQSKASQVEGLQPVLSSVKMVLSATNLASGMKKQEGVALEVYRAHREVRDVCQVVKISITQDGTLVKEDYITCCPKLCTIIATQSYKVEVDALVDAGVDSKTIVKNIDTFLNDHVLSMVNLSSSMKN